MTAPTAPAPLHEIAIADERVLLVDGLTLVASASEPGTWHRVSPTSCDCKGFTYRNTCRHLAVAAEAAAPAEPTCKRCHQPAELMHTTGLCAICLTTRPAD